MTVNFWSFTKKSNSTARPSATPAQSLDCKLKDQSGVLRPVLEVAGISNPSALNYAQIPTYGRYYYVTDWTYYRGIWEASLQVDAMATYKNVIGSESKYVLRSAHARDINLVDDLYPSLTWAVDEEYTGTFNWSRSITAGHFVVGIVNRSQHLGMPVTYYDIAPSEIRDLMELMLPQPVTSWTASLDYTNQALIRAIYDPMQFVVSCKWFPCPITADQYEYVGFGNWDGNFLSDVQSERIVGNPVSNPANWQGYLQTINLPSGWLSRPGRERSAPYCHMFLKINPWGVIELDPNDFTTATTLRLEAYPDYISGDCRLDVYAQVTSNQKHLIYQSNAKIGVDIPLANTAQNVGTFLTSLAGTVGSIAAAATSEGLSAAAASLVSAAGGALDAAQATAPTMTRSGGIMSGMVNLDGEGLLRIRTQYFAGESNAEFGRPLFDVRQLSTLPGYIKCADGHLDVAAYPEETAEIENYLTGGFFYE